MKEIAINKGQHFSDVLPLIPTGTIINKKLTGLGATYTELKTPRHSIIVEPNVPVIKNKCAKAEHQEDNLFGIYEGIPTKAVEDYIAATLAMEKHIKLLTTSESFHKVKQACSKARIDMYKECFLLLDEYHRFVKDVDYREDITLPFQDFFHFKNKALVSATPLGMTHPRLEDFEYMEFVPQYPVTKAVMLYPTNNILESLKRTIGYLEGDDKPICVFLNSTDAIHTIIGHLGIKEETAVFCAPKSVERLQCKGMGTSYTDFKPELMKKYNFFTSRFFCALDIELEEKPHLIAITNIKRTQYTAIHPQTDMVQIIGRFRNGVDKIIHITDLDGRLPKDTIKELYGSVTLLEGYYEGVEHDYQNAVSREQRIALGQILENHPFKKFLSVNINPPYQYMKDHFKIDNHVDEQLTLSLYNSLETLKGKYRETGMFHVIEIKDGFYKEEEKYDKLIIPTKAKTMKEKRRYIVQQLERMENWEAPLYKKEWRDKLHKAEPFIVEAYETIGKEKIEELGYSQQKIREAMILKKYEAKRHCTALVEMVKNTFDVRRVYKVSLVKGKIKEIFNKLDILSPYAVTASTIENYFEVTHTWTGKQGERARAVYIVREKF